MAEVVGVVAGAVQFLDVGSRVLISLSRFCSDLQHVPRKIQRVRRQLEQTLQLVESIKSDVDAPNTGPGTTLSGIISQPDVDYAKGLLDDAAALVAELQVLLNKLTLTGDGLVKKAWRAVVAVKKEEEILSKCSDIETTTRLLQTWMHHQSLKLIRDDILVDKDNARKISNVGQTLRTVQQSLGDIPQAIENIVQTSKTAVLREIDTNTHHLGEHTRRIDQNMDSVRHEVLQGITTTERNTHGMFRSLRGEIIDEFVLDRTSRSSESQALHSQLASMQQAMNQLLIQHTSQRLISKPSYLEDIEDSVRYAAPQPTIARNVHIPTRPGYGTLCTCTSWRTRAHRTWGNFRFRYDPSLVHHSNCPLHHQSKRSWTIGARAILPALWSYCIDMALQIDFGAGGFAISPSIRRSARIVDRSTSPAFRALRSLQEFALLQTSVKSNMESLWRNYFERFRDHLCQAFRDGRAAAYDQDQYGQTLLKGFLQAFYDCNKAVYLDDLVTSIVDLLCEGGAEDPGFFLDGSHDHFVFLARVFSRYSYNIELGHCFFSSHTLKEICHSADLSFEYNLPPRYVAAVQKSLPLLQESIKNHTFEEYHGKLPSPLTFALHWPEGRRMLLAAGANPLNSISYALKFQDMEAFVDLINEDLPFFDRDDRWNLLELCFVRNRLPTCIRNAPMDMIISHLIQLRRRLLTLALQQLPSREQKGLNIYNGIRQEDVPDRTLLRAYQKLKSINANTPSFLYPGCQTSVYHLGWVTYFPVRPAGAVFLAERLFRAGFRQIDIKDDRGLRPVELACAEGSLSMAAWLLQHGAVPKPKLIWSIAAVSDILWRESLKSLSVVIAFCGYPENDTCKCYCSSRGCLPHTGFLKSSRKFSRKFLELWIRHIPQETQLVSYKEACRLRLFEKLGMSHTCCSFTNDRTNGLVRRELPMDDQLEIREEESEFSSILDRYMRLFNHLLEESIDTFPIFWDAWWSAINITLPGLEGNGYWRRIRETRPELDHFEDYGPHEKLIRLVVSYYSGLVESLTRFVRLSGPWNVLRYWVSYFEAPEVPTYSDYDMSGIQHLPESFDMSCPTPDLPLFDSNLSLPRLLYLDPPERIQKATAYIIDELIPAIAPVIIFDLHFGRSIPEDIRQHLEAEGLLQDGVVVRPTSTEDDPETIFEDCINTLFNPSHF